MKIKNEKIEFVIRGGIFLFGMLICLILLSVLVRPKDNTRQSGANDYQAKGIYSQKRDSIDILAVGSSNLWCGYIPMQIYQNEGFTSYNSASLMQHSWHAYYFLKRIYKKQTPKVVLLDADMFFIEGSTPMKEFSDFMKNTFYRIFPVIEYHDRWKDLTKEDLSFDVKHSFDTPMKGLYYVQTKEPYKKHGYMNQKFHNEKITALEHIFIDKIVDLCKEHKTKVILVEAPAAGAWNYKRHQAVLKYAKEQNLDFLDANIKDIGIDWSQDTRDGGDHLNYYGAKKFTAYIETYLKTHVALKDKRQEKGYQNWNKECIQFQKMIQGN